MDFVEASLYKVYVDNFIWLPRYNYIWIFSLYVDNCFVEQRKSHNVEYSFIEQRKSHNVEYSFVWLLRCKCFSLILSGYAFLYVDNYFNGAVS